MDILVLYAQKFKEKNTRKTLSEHLYSFRQYTQGHHFYYLNVLESSAINNRVAGMPFDAVVFHTLFLAQRCGKTNWEELYKKLKPKLAAFSGYKIMLPQDDYNYTEELWRIIDDCKVDHVFSVMPVDQIEVAYPHLKSEKTTYSTVLTGYVDERNISVIEGEPPFKRNIDIGYRANALPYWFGHHGMLKTQITDVFINALKDCPDIKADIMNTIDRKNAFMGDDWTKFLLSCRCMLGCLGGSSILDPDGSVAARVKAYCAEHPNAKYEEVKKACYPNQEDSIRGFAPSPRIFECALTKTCQLLVEGDYFGIIEPGVDYIEIKKDFSNMPEVLEKVRDYEYCERIAEQCYEHVVRPGDPNNPYTYRWFANHIIDYIEKHRDTGATVKMTPRMHKYMARRCAYFSSNLYLNLNMGRIMLNKLKTKEGRVRIRILVAQWLKQRFI